VNRAEVYPVGPDQSLAEALREDGTPVPLPAQPQGESITVSPSVPELLLHSEGAKQPISAVELPVGLLDTLRAEQDASRPSPWSGPLIRLGLVAFIGAIGTFAFLTIRNRRRRDTAHAPKTVVDLRDRSNQPQQ
jgi:hypothetical protein